MRRPISDEGEMKPIRLVCATRCSPEAFKKTLLGSSLWRLGNVSCDIVYNNRDGLCKVYNRFLVPQYQNEILVFLHDDIGLDDYWLQLRCNEATEKFDVVGLTGLSYIISDRNWNGASPWDCGAVAEPHRMWRPATNAPHRVYTVDGQCIAINTEKILASGIYWDEQFTFDFYDIDFCRQCNEKGLLIGVWPIALTHGGKGSAGTASYNHMLKLFNAKWNR